MGTVGGKNNKMWCLGLLRHRDVFSSARDGWRCHLDAVLTSAKRIENSFFSDQTRQNKLQFSYHITIVPAIATIHLLKGVHFNAKNIFMT